MLSTRQVDKKTLLNKLQLNKQEEELTKKVFEFGALSESCIHGVILVVFMAVGELTGRLTSAVLLLL